MSDPYHTLGVARNASAEDIKSAYRKLAKTHHPDLNPGDARVEKRFKEISQAYGILGDKTKRARFDRGEIDANGQETVASGFRRSGSRAGASGGQGPFGFGENVTVEDIFSEMFSGRSGFGGGGGFGGKGGFGQGGFGRGGGGRRQSQAGGRARADVKQKGADITYKADVDFLEAALGTKARVSLTDGKSLEVSIPPGTTDGQSLRLKGQGLPGMGGAAAGDAYIEVTVKPHPHFSLQDRDVHLELPISLQEAVLGGKVEIPTIHGRVSMKVPAGANSGTTLRLKGKGISAGKTAPAGDQIVKLKVVLPETVDEDLESFVRAWSHAHAYNPRDGRDF